MINRWFISIRMTICRGIFTKALYNTDAIKASFSAQFLLHFSNNPELGRLYCKILWIPTYWIRYINFNIYNNWFFKYAPRPSKACNTRIIDQFWAPYSFKLKLDAHRVSVLAENGFAAFGKGIQLIIDFRVVDTEQFFWLTSSSFHLMEISKQSSTVLLGQGFEKAFNEPLATAFHFVIARKNINLNCHRCHRKTNQNYLCLQFDN